MNEKEIFSTHKAIETLHQPSAVITTQVMEKEGLGKCCKIITTDHINFQTHVYLTKTETESLKAELQSMLDRMD